MAIEFVGYITGADPVSGSAYALYTGSLTGGIGTSAQIGDLLVIASGWASTANADPGVASPGFTEVADLYANGTNDANMSVAWMLITGSVPSFISINSSGSSANGSCGLMMVFRGVDPSAPLDATVTTATGTGSSTGNPPAITPVTTGAAIVAVSLMAATNAGTFSAAAGYTAGGTLSSQGGTRGSGVGGCYKLNVAGGIAQDPGTMTASAGGSGASWCAATLALRPALGRIKHYTGSNWAAKPVKHWNGAAWVQKPLKVWNGTSWVRTNY